MNFTIAAGTKETNIVMSGCRITDFGEPSPNEGINEYTVTLKPTNVNAVSNDAIVKYNPW